MATTFTITADSSPVYDDWGDADYWSCDDWVLWYNQLLGKYTPDQADYLWSKAWLDGVSGISGGNGTAPGSNYIVDSSPLSCRSFNQNFKDFLSKHPNLTSAVYSGIGGLLAKPVGFGVDIVNGVITVGENALNTVTATSAVLKYAIPISIAVLVLFILFIVLRHVHSNSKELTK